MWASRETPDEIDLRIRYVNPSGVSKIFLDAFVENGSVAGAPPRRLWKGNKKWGVNQDWPFIVKRKAGVSNTKIVVTAGDGSTPAILNFQRADGTLSLTYAGAVELLRQRGREAAQRSPDNNENRGGCPNFVGKHDGKYCTSRTTVSIATQPPYFFRNPQGGCRGSGCPWSSDAPARLDNERSASYSRDNWGPAIDVFLDVDEYERLDRSKCGGDGPIPVIFGQSVVFTAGKECLPLASLKWVRQPDGSAGVVHFGENAVDKTVVMAEPPQDLPTVVLIGYKLNAPIQPNQKSLAPALPAVKTTDFAIVPAK